MPTDTNLRLELIARVSEVAQKKLSSEEHDAFLLFLEQVIHVHPEDSLFRYSKEDVYGAFYGLYRFGLERNSNTASVEVFNPDIEDHGWACEHTVIYFCQTDMPFLVDSLRMALNRLAVDIHLFQSSQVYVRRDTSGKLGKITNDGDTEAAREDFGIILIDLHSQQSHRDDVQEELENVFRDVATVVNDFEAMVNRIDEEIHQLKAKPIEGAMGEEITFLEWLRDGNFTFLGISEFDQKETSKGVLSTELTDKRLGLMKLRNSLKPQLLSELSQGFADFYHSSELLAFTKSVQRSTVHRNVYADYVILKRHDNDGNPIGEIRFLGLYTSRLYHKSIQEIPLVRKKTQWLLEHSQLDGSSHNGKTFISILEGHPRDELIQGSARELLDTMLGIWKIYERRTVRLFIRTDPFEKFASCIVYLPRESLRTQLRERIEQRLASALNAKESEFTTQFLAESVLARIHIVFHITDDKFRSVNVSDLEAELTEIVRNWEEILTELALDHWGDEEGRRIMHRYGDAFPASYQEHISPDVALHDLALFHDLGNDNDLAMSFFHAPEAEANIMRLKLFRREANLELSDLIPMLENLGFRVLVEHPYELVAREGSKVFMLDFTLRFALDLRTPLDISAVRSTFEDAFMAIWRGQSESDAFNRLVLGARLDWRSVLVLRAYARYMKQLGLSFSVEFIADVLSRHLEITRNLIALFRSHFDPRLRSDPDDESSARSEEKRSERTARLRDKIIESLDSVQSLNEDQVIRTYLGMIEATKRTNFFQTEQKTDLPKVHLSLKIATRELDEAPEPKPAFEIFVYSPEMEGVHLRGGKVARGGIRWSDRYEDYRTEILGLVKAQNVKNAVIVPSGAKGGFILKRNIADMDREAWAEAGKNAYRTLIRGMLDLTDNRKGQKIINPQGVVCRDDDDPYLVVAADKGTAQFSDIANEISAEYDFWLGDAFASGGSQGYDHKKMGITARGAWVAVQQHFREQSINVDQDDFTVLGIGDMAGDVFGNGVLLSKHIKLLAAFNHQHIFVDPQPDPEKSWQERKRLFEMERSTWENYDKDLISTGGGIFSRSAKSVDISAEIKEHLGIEEDKLTPNELIHCLLKAPVDLIWNGGIGTYVKASHESHLQVGDRTNDNLRVDGKELRCRVFGEGGNLGMTQAGRIEYCHQGGTCNADFIDNSAGVDCSDHEVNIKILFNELFEDQELTLKQRNKLLSEMEDSVAEKVLRNNYEQTLSISLARHRRSKHHHDYVKFLEYLETEGYMKRQLEGLPDEETLRERVAKDIHWTRPELSVLICYAKIVLKEQFATARLGDDPLIGRLLNKPFPDLIEQHYPQYIDHHRLKNEIVATQMANLMVDRMGFTFCYRMQESVGAAPDKVARGFMLVNDLFELDQLWDLIEQQNYQIESETQYELYQQIIRLARRSTRWFLRNHRKRPMEDTAETMSEGLKKLSSELPDLLPDDWSLNINESSDAYQEVGVPGDLARQISLLDIQFLLPGIVATAIENDKDPVEVGKLRFLLSDRLSTFWLMQLLIDWQPENRWQDFARESHVDELEGQMRRLTGALFSQKQSSDTATLVEEWAERESVLIGRFEKLVKSLRGGVINDLSSFTVALRELKDLVDASVFSAQK